MPNVAALGLSFDSGNAGSKIEELCKKFDTLAEKCGSVQKAFDSLSASGMKDSLTAIGNALSGLKAVDKSVTDSIGNLAVGIRKLSGIDAEAGNNIKELFSALNALPKIDNATTVQISAVSAAMKNFHGIEPGTAEGITSIIIAISGLKPIGADISTGLSAFADGLKNITVSSETVSAFNGISAMMSSLKPIDPAIGEGLRKLVADVNNMTQIRPEITQGIMEFFSSVNSVKIDGSINTQIGELSKSFTGLKAVKPEVAVSIKEIFEVFKSAKPIGADVITGIAKLGEATSQFKVIRPQITASIEKLMNILSAIPNIDSEKTESLRRTAEATAIFKAIKPNVTQSIGELFVHLKNMKTISPDIASSLSAVSNALLGFKAVNKKVADNVREIFRLIENFKPIPENAISSIRTLADMFKAMGSAGPVGSAAKANMQYTDSLSGLYARADAAAIAMRSLQGAFSVRFMVQASKDAADFGTELAYIKTLAQDYDLAKIGTGIMDFSSQLGNATKNAKAFYYAYSAGMRGTEEDLLRFTEENAKLAKVIRSDVIPTMNATTAAINAYGLSARDIGQVSDVFSSIVKYGKASGEQLASGLGQVISTAATAGLSLDEMGASVASLTKVMQTRNAITYFNNMLSKMIKPTKATQQEAEKLGIELGLNALRAKGFAGMMQEIHDKTQGAQDSLLRLFPDLRGQRAALQLLNKGWDDFQQQLTNFQNKAGETDREFSVLTNDINAQIQALPQTFEKIVQESGKALLDLVTFGGTLTPVVAAFNNMGEGARKFFGTITAGISVYGTFKALNLAYTTYQALQARNEQILNAQKVQKIALQRAELKEKARAIMAAKAEAMMEVQVIKATAARNAMIAQKIRMQAAEHAQRALEISNKMYLIENELAEAKARGNNILAMKLENDLRLASHQFKIAETKASAAETHALRMEALARAQNAKAATAEAAAVSISGKSKTAKVIQSITTPISLGITAAVVGLGITKHIPGFKLLAKVIGGLSPAMVKVSTLMTGMVTSLKSVGVGVGAVTTGLNATALATSLIGAKLTGLGAAGAAAGAGIATTGVAVGGLVAGTAAFGYVAGRVLYSFEMVKNIIDPLVAKIQWAKDKILGNETLEDAEKRSKALDLKKSLNDSILAQVGTAQNALKEVNEMRRNAALEEMSGIEKMKALHEREIRAREGVNKNTYKSVKKKEEELIFLQKNMLAAENSEDTVKAYKKVIERTSQELKKAESAYKAAQNEQIAVNKAIKEMYEEVKESSDKIRGIFDEQMFKMMDPKGQRLEFGNRFMENVRNYYQAVQSWNTKLAEESAKNIVQNYDKLYSGAKKKIEDNKKLSEQLEQMQLDAMLQSATDSGKYAIYRKSLLKSFSETQMKANTGDIAGATASWQKTMGYAQKMIGIRNRLAESEKRANESTLKMIQAMDQYKSHAVDAVDAYSIEAVKLQARSYDTMPQMKESTTAQSSADQLSQWLSQNTTAFAEKMQQMIKADNEKTQQEQSRYDAIFKSVDSTMKDSTSAIKQGFNEIKEKLSNTRFKVEIASGMPEIKSVRV